MLLQMKLKKKKNVILIFIQNLIQIKYLILILMLIEIYLKNKKSIFKKYKYII